MTYAQRIDREEEGARLRAMLRDEHYAARERIAQAFRYVTLLGLMEWQDPPELTPRQYARLEGLRNVYRPFDPQGETEPFDVDQDWSDCGN